MTELRTTIEEEAIGWIIRIRDPHFDDWDAFAAWMEDPVQALTYSEMAIADGDVAEVLKSGTPVPARAANDDDPPSFWRARRTVFGGAIAAALLAAIGFTIMPIGPSAYTVVTAAGERKAIRLEDGSRIDVNGGTQLVLDRRNARYARLVSGEASFSVIHDTAKPFVVETGGSTLVDAGTAFNVTRIGSVTEVAVSQGLVIYNPRAEKLAIAPGRMVHVGDGQQPIMHQVDPHAVASWREGRLIYNGASLANVVNDLSRNLGIAITVSPELADRRISAVIQLNGRDRKAIADIGALLGVETHRVNQGWQFSAEGNATR